MAFSPSWNVKGQTGNRNHLGSAPDPALGVVTPHDQAMSANPGAESWMSQSGYPGAGSIVLSENGVFDGASGGGPVDHTPVDHTTGVGFGAGLDARTSQEQNAQWHSADWNATAARRWSAPMDSDGIQHADRIAEAPPTGLWGSPETVMLKYGTNPAAYPNGQITGHRIQRWRDRIMDRRGYTPDHRPLFTPNAYTARNVPAGAGGYASPAPQQGHVNVLMEKAPQRRVVPTSWSDPIITDPTSGGYVEPSLDIWGL
jgi:hypothetical protein